MANSEHVKRLLAGAKGWNTWRREHPEIRPDLSHAELTGAKLTRAKLTGAKLTRAKLTRADLYGAELTGAELTGAELTGAELTRAQLYETTFVNLDLSETKGLDECLHHGPSPLDSRTLARSGPMPLAFLRGCGLSDWEIEAAKLYQKGLTPDQVTDIGYKIIELNTGDVIQYASCFISYSSADEPFCQELHHQLQESGVRAWFAPEHIRWGDHLRPQLDQAIHHHDRVLLILTETSMASDWVKYELQTTLAREKEERRRILFPLRLVDFKSIKAWDCFDDISGTNLAAYVARYYIPGDFEHWRDAAAFNDAFAKLLRDLRADDAAGET